MFNPLNTNINLSYIYSFRFYHAANILHLGYDN
jgi:hypothetical protein